MTSHGALLDELHVHAPGAITRTDAGPPDAEADPDEDSNSNVHVKPDCRRLTV